MFDKLKEMKKNKKSTRKYTQESLPFSKFYEDGLMQVGDIFSKTIFFEDINYKIAKEEVQEMIFQKYCDFLNGFDANIYLQITINNTKIDKENFAEEISIENKEDKYNYYRKEYNKYLKDQLKTKNQIKRDKYITISVKAENEEEAISKLKLMEKRTENALKKIGQENTKVKTLEYFQRSELLASIYNPKIKLDFKSAYIKDTIAPDEFVFKTNLIQINDKYAKVIYLTDIPSFMTDEIINDFSELPIDLVISLHIESVPQHEAVRLVQKQITGMEGNKIEYQRKAAKSGYSSDILPPSLSHSLEHAKELLDFLRNKNQKMFLVSIVIMHRAKTIKELEKNQDALLSVSRKHLCQLKTLKYQQEDGLNTVLPYGKNFIGVKRTLTTESVAIFMPFNNHMLRDKDGIFYGTNSVDNSMIFLNRIKQRNSSGVIIGTPGSGKSFSAKKEIVSVFLSTDDDIFIIDPEREYTNLVKNMGGEIIPLCVGADYFINPLDITKEYSDKKNPIIFKSEFLMSLVEMMLGKKLTAKEKTIIDRCIRMVYTDYIKSQFMARIPNLSDLYKLIKTQEEKEAKEIALALEIYVDEGAFSIFSKNTNVNLKNRVIAYDIKDLGSQLKQIGMLVAIDNIWNRVTQNRDIGKRTWIYMDEIYLMFNNEYSSKFVFELYKRARKYGGVPTGITQNVEDLLNSSEGKSMLSNSDFLMMFNQSPADREELQDLLKMTDEQLGYVTHSNEGNGLIFSNGAIVPFSDKFPTNLKLYEMMTTKVDEVANLNKPDLKKGDLYENRSKRL